MLRCCGIAFFRVPYCALGGRTARVGLRRRIALLAFSRYIAKIYTIIYGYIRVSSDHQTVEETPDTVVTLTNGKKLIVEESMEEIVRRVMEYRRSMHGL
ncbi:MAG: flagellar FlbD family protein [Bacteroides sp.]